MLKKNIYVLAVILFTQGILLAQTSEPVNNTAYKLGFSTYLSHTDKYVANLNIFTDAEGYTYYLGCTRDKNFPSTIVAYQTELKGEADAFVEKFAQDGVSIGKSKKFQSPILGGEVTYLVHMPDGYDNSTKEYPVIYMMNGQSVSSSANAAATMDNLSNERIPDMILIGISNTGVAASYRSCPDDSGKVKLGDSFSRFLKEDLIPEVRKNYRTNDYKILFGQSNTGLFVLYNLMSYPDLFNAYIVASPMFGWCPQYFADKIRTFLNTNPELNKKLYLSYGDLDYIEVLRYINDFKDVLKQSPTGFQYKVDLIENAGHVPYITLNNALLYFFSECTLNAERKKLSIPEIKSHFEKLSAEYGFTVIPKAGVLFDMAIDNKNETKYDRAIELFKYLNSLYPGSEIYNYVLGSTYLLKGNINLAKESFNESLKINPDFSQAKNELDKLINKK
jgi:predicted alpha/beta superfamily hydrolase